MAQLHEKYLLIATVILCLYFLFQLSYFGKLRRQMELDFDVEMNTRIARHKENKLTRAKRKPNGYSLYPVSLNQSYQINNKDICTSSHKISTIVMINARPSDTSLRRNMRKYLRNSTYFAKEDIRYVFLIGDTLDEEIQTQIEYESGLFKDIVQGFFYDSYKNLTNKGIMGFKWISEHCMNAKLVTKVDVDMFVDFDLILSKFKFMTSMKKMIFCSDKDAGTAPIIRNPISPWYVDPNEFKGLDYFPETYCSGCIVILSTDLIPLLYQAAFTTPFFWIDDYYLFGDLPAKVNGVTHKSLDPLIIFTWNEFTEKCNYSTLYTCDFLAVHSNAFCKVFELWNIWKNKILENNKESKKK